MYVCKTNFKCLSSSRGEPQVIYMAGQEYTGPHAEHFLKEGFVEEKADKKADKKVDKAVAEAPVALPKAKKSAPKASVAQAG